MWVHNYVYAKNVDMYKGLYVCRSIKKTNSEKKICVEVYTYIQCGYVCIVCIYIYRCIYMYIYI
jgi:hypothetical protein